MQDTINIMFKYEKIIRIYLFCPFLAMKQKTNTFYKKYCDKTSHPPWWGEG